MRKYILTIIVIISIFMTFFGCKSSPKSVNETRACWVSSIRNLDFPSKPGLDSEKLQSEIDEIVLFCSEMGLNTIFFQVRPSGDALYESSVYPWSEYLSGVQGLAPNDHFDPLAYFVESAHEKNIELHAWINPYRVGLGSDVTASLSEDNPAKKHPEYTVLTNDGLYYNPGLPEVRQLVLDGISELVQHYEIDGIHFDDYFYPYDMSLFNDTDTYLKYGNGMSLEDYRRNAVDRLVESASVLIKTLDDSVEFGISPFGIWANSSEHPEGSATRGLSAYYDIFSDSKKWVESGWVDYICPQIYWSKENEIAPYNTVVEWWDRICVESDVRLYVGLAVYKVGSKEAGWGSGEVIGEQLSYAASKKSYAGHCFFRYKILKDNPLGTKEAIIKHYNSVS